MCQFSRFFCLCIFYKLLVRGYTLIKGNKIATNQNLFFVCYHITEKMSE